MNLKHAGVLLVLLAAAAHAEVYKSINTDGQVIYSDVPSSGAERVQMPALPTYTPVPLPAVPAAPASAKQDAGFAYKTFTMASPSDEETIRGTAGDVSVSVALEPALQVEDGHRIQYFLDDKPYGKPSDRLSTGFPNVDRGAHRVSAAIIDASGRPIINAAPVTIYIHR